MRNKRRKTTLFCLAGMVILFAVFSLLAGCGSGTKQLPDFVLPLEGEGSYIIVRSERASQEEISLITNIRKKITEETGVNMVLKDDFVKEGTKYQASDWEICIGATNREESQRASEGLRIGDYRIRVDGTRVVIAYGSADAAKEALERFVNDYVFAKEKVIAVPSDLNIEVIQEYPLDSLAIGGTDIRDFVIVGDKDFTSAVHEAIAKLTGYSVRTSETAIGRSRKIMLGTLDDISPEEAGVRLVNGDLVAGTSGEYYTKENALPLLLKLINDNNGAALTGKDVNTKEKIDNPDLVFISDKDLAALRAETDKHIAAIRATTGTPKITGMTYYVSPKGNDTNSGTSPEQAWKTLTRVNSAPLRSGDGVLFERGGVWRGQITANKAGVTYSAYGTGDKPKIYGSPENSADASKWIATDLPYVWKYYKASAEDVGTFVFNDGESCAIKRCIRTDGPTPVDRITGKPLESYKDLEEDLHFYQDRETGEIWMRSEKGNPGTRFRSIEMNPKHHVVAVSANGITVDNLCIMYGGAHGVGAGTCKNLTVTNCEFRWIGGSILTYNHGGNNPGVPVRYGNAVEIYGSCDGYRVSNCYFYQIYDTGITNQASGEGKLITMKNIEYSDNVFDCCNWSVEYYISSLEADNKSMMSNFRIVNNLMWYAGYGFCEQRPDKDGAAHIKSWMSGAGTFRRNPAEDFYVGNNLFVYSTGQFLQIFSTDDGSMPVMEGNTYIQSIGGPLGVFGVRDTTLSPYDANAKSTIVNKFGDTQATVWFTREPYSGER